jgi:uncharacterized membrane protein
MMHFTRSIKQLFDNCGYNLRMKLKITEPRWQVVGLGLLAGMRTSSAPAITSHILSRQRSRQLEKSSLAFMQSNKVATVMKLFVAAELIADKLPSTANRIKPVGLVARCLSGALAGASIYKASGYNVMEGMILGTSAALASTFCSFLLRKSIVKQTRIFDPLIGALEDALVIGAGVGLSEVA